MTFQGIGRVQVDEVPDPRLLALGDALVRVRLTAVCGSDLHVLHGRERGIDPGTVMGHEFVGEIVELGADVHGFAPGDRVVSPFTTACGSCFYCRQALSARCVSGQLFGWVAGGVGLEGAQAEYVRVPLAAGSLLAVPADVTDEQALLLADVLPTGDYCAQLGGIQPGQSCVVLGCGPIGVMAVLGAAERGAQPLWAIDSVPSRLELARRFGATPLDLRAGDLVARIREATEGRGADAALECVGTPEAMRLAFDLLRPGGTLAAVGVHHEPHLPFSPGEAYDRNLTLRVGRCPARSLQPELLQRLRKVRRDIAEVISHRLSLDQAERGYTIFDQKLEDCTKVVLRP